MQHRRSSTQIALLAFGALVLALLPAEVVHTAGGRGGRAPRLELRDAQGRVVRSRSGRRIRYRADGEAKRGLLARAVTAHGSPPPRTRYEAADASILSLEWNRAVLGTGIGLTGLFAADVDHDGTVEIVAGGGLWSFGGNDRVFLLSRLGAGYEQEWVSLPYPDGVSAVRIAQLDADGPLELLVASGPSVFVYDGAGHGLERSLPLPEGIGAVGDLDIADVDADGALELVVCGSVDIVILDAATSALEWRGTGQGGTSLATGQLDADAALEVVVARGSASGSAIDGKTHVGQWSAVFGEFVRVADLDGDGIGEVVAGLAWDDMVVYEGDTHATKYTVPVFNLGAVRTVDTDGNGSVEIVYGDAQWGKVHVLDGSTGSEMWAVSNPEHGTTDVAVGDVDGDGVREVLWGAGHSSSGPDYLYVADGTTHAIEWQSLDVSGPFYGLDHGDVDGDGAPEILYAAQTSDSGYGDGLFFVHDAATKALEYVSPEPTGLDWTGLWRVRTANVDADPQGEVLFTTSRLYTGILVCQDGLTHAEQWRFVIPDGLAYRSLQVGDVDGDGALEAVAGMEAQHSGAPGLYVDVYDAATGALEWRSPSFLVNSSTLSLLRLANVDADPQLEVVVAAYGGKVRVLDPVEQSVQLTTATLGVTALDTPDRDGDGRAEIVVGTGAGEIRALDPATGAVTGTIGSWGSRIDGLAFDDLNGDGGADLLFTADGRLRVLAGGTSAVVVTTDFLGENAGAHDSLLVADVDGDGRTEVMVNGGFGGLLVFEFAGGPDAGPPTVALTAPLPGALLEGVVALQATASDDWAVERVEFLVDGVVLGTDFQEPYALDWDTVPFDAGPHVLEARARDGAGHETTSAPVAVTVKDATGDASYDPRRKAPTCPKPSAHCDSGGLLVGRRQLGPEPNFPNVVNGSCWDGWAGAFHYSGSNDRIRVSTLDGSTLSAGKRARVEVWVFGGPRTPLGLPGNKKMRKSGWKLDVFASASDSAPAWFHVATIPTTTTGLQKLTAEYTLPAGRLQVVRARYRYYGRVSPCDWGVWNDHDDLVFSVR